MRISIIIRVIIFLLMSFALLSCNDRGAGSAIRQSRKIVFNDIEFEISTPIAGERYSPFQVVCHISNYTSHNYMILNDSCIYGNFYPRITDANGNQVPMRRDVERTLLLGGSNFRRKLLPGEDYYDQFDLKHYYDLPSGEYLFSIATDMYLHTLSGHIERIPEITGITFKILPSKNNPIP